VKARLPSFRSVQSKLFAGVLLTSMVATLLTGGSLFIIDLVTYRKINTSDLAVQAELLANATTAALQFDDRAVAQQNLAFLTARPSIRVAAIYDAGGVPFASYTRQDVPASSAAPPGPRLDTASITGDRLEVYRQIRVGKEILGTVYLQSDLYLGERIAAYAAIAFAVTLAAFGVALLLSTRLQPGITRPITQISHLAHEVVARRDYSLRATRTTDDEVGALAVAFNEMLSEI
jgi:methyl-accepting chemotaxis protein